MTNFAPRPNWLGQPIAGATPFGGVEYAVEFAVRMADALIEIATAFAALGPDPEIVMFGGFRVAVRNGCDYCHNYFEDGCAADCPGLIARRALGVA